MVQLLGLLLSVLFSGSAVGSVILCTVLVVQLLGLLLYVMF